MFGIFKNINEKIWKLEDKLFKVKTELEKQVLQLNGKVYGLEVDIEILRRRVEQLEDMVAYLDKLYESSTKPFLEFKKEEDEKLKEYMDINEVDEKLRRGGEKMEDHEVPFWVEWLEADSKKRLELVEELVGATILPVAVDPGFSKEVKRKVISGLLNSYFEDLVETVKGGDEK